MTTSDLRPTAASVHEQEGVAWGTTDVLDAVGVAVIVADRDGTILYRNATAKTLLPDGGDLDSAFVHARFFEPFTGWTAELAHVFDSHEERRVDSALGGTGTPSPRMVSIRCTPLEEPGTHRVSAVVMSVLEGRGGEIVEQQLEISKRLASLGKLATRVAHELNNPLDGILRYTNLAMRLVDDVPESKLKSYLTQSRIGLMRMLQIIGDLLEYSRTTEGNFDAVAIDELVEQAIKSNAAAADAAGIVVAADFQDQDMPQVSGSRLYQVCCNLIKNAIDAMPDGGRLSLTAGLVGDDVMIRVEDTGVGLPDPPAKVFEAFFTTKAPGKGTGLGLAICKDFIEDMNGTIRAAPGRDGGAVFTLRIPIASCTVVSRSALTPTCRDRDETASAPS